MIVMHFTGAGMMKGRSGVIHGVNETPGVEGFTPPRRTVGCLGIPPEELDGGVYVDTATEDQVCHRPGCAEIFGVKTVIGQAWDRCPLCNTEMPAGARKCPNCDFEWGDE